MEPTNNLITPGEILREEFLHPMGITPYQLAKHIRVPVGRITAILRGERAITADTAIRLGLFFDVDPQWFMNMQSFYDMSKERLSLEAIQAEVTPLARSNLVQRGS